MKKIVLVSCASQKLDEPAPAKDLYISALFTKNMAYAKTLQPDSIFILSAKYGLLTLDEEIEPYDVTLKNMKSSEVKAWARRVLAQLAKYADLEADEFVFLAGMPYRKYLVPQIKHVQVPLEGMGIGKQLQFLTQRAEDELAPIEDFWDE